MHVMLDLETFSTRNNAAIVAIGAVAFDDENRKIIDKFYTGIFPSSCQQFGMHIDAGTVEWWLAKERAPAREKLFNEDQERVDIATGLYAFARWTDQLLAAEKADNALLASALDVSNKYEPQLMMWGNGATFDNVIMRNAFDAVHLECPWKFYNDRCYRTIKNLAPEIKVPRMGTFHCALDDAESQTTHLFQIMEAANIVRL